MKDARDLLAHSLADPNWSRPPAPRDAYMYHANALGLAAANSGMLSTAAEVYVALINDIKERIASTGEQLPIGLLLVNLGAVYFAQGHYDRGVFFFLEAARNDAVVSGNSPDDSYALTHLLPAIVERSVLDKTLEAVQAIVPQITPADINVWYMSLGNRRYTYLAYMLPLLDNRKFLLTHPHEYSYWQVFSSLRNLSALFEVEIKRSAGERSLFDALRSLYDRKSWWPLFEVERQRVGATQNSVVPSETRLRHAFTISYPGREAQFWKSLLITYITRNYTVHEMDAPNVLGGRELDVVLENVLYTMIAGQSFA